MICFYTYRIEQQENYLTRRRFSYNNSNYFKLNYFDRIS